MTASEDRLYARKLAAILEINRQPTLRELYARVAGRDVMSVLSVKQQMVCDKTIIVDGSNQFFGDAHADLVLGRMADATPSAYMRMIELLSLKGCGFVTHELFADGHVCKSADRVNHLDCAHSISRKVLESALALVANDADAMCQPLEHLSDAFAIFAHCDRGVVKLDRALGEVARGPRYHDSVGTLASETGLPQITEETGLGELITTLHVIRPILEQKQAEYARPLLQLARDIAPNVFRLLQGRLIEWCHAADDCGAGRSFASAEAS
ncbi:MAG: hypothetical protein JNL18_18665 [Planctomycetaceae bacterium]|nr:hypothetical protein [Planctomycetaceae bacterium]